LSNMKSLR